LVEHSGADAGTLSASLHALMLAQPGGRLGGYIAAGYSFTGSAIGH
jgi:hypothetical protein